MTMYLKSNINLKVVPPMSTDLCDMIGWCAVLVVMPPTPAGPLTAGGGCASGGWPKFGTGAIGNMPSTSNDPTLTLFCKQVSSSIHLLSYKIIGTRVLN